MDRQSPIEAKRQYLRQRAQQLLKRVNRMDDEELRWTVRVFADCLSPRQRMAFLGAYSEHWPVEDRRRFLPVFIQRYTQVALDTLERSVAVRGGGLAAGCSGATSTGRSSRAESLAATSTSFPRIIKMPRCTRRVT